MELTININFENEEQYQEILVIGGDTINISTQKHTKIIDLLKNKEEIIEQLEIHQNYLNDQVEEFNKEQYIKEQEYIKILRNNIDKLIDIIEYVYLDLPYEEVIQYIEENPILKTKKITINGNFEVNHNSIKEVKEIFKDYPNICIKLDGNTKEYSIQECEQTIYKIDEITNHIKQFNFSPLEQIMYTYDLIRDKIYNEEEKEESFAESRDLTKVLFGNKIVCVGYSNIYNAILNKLGFKSKVYHLDGLNKESGHAINIAYIKDEKYNIDGVYYFDLTADSKKKEKDNIFLNSYYCFLKRNNELFKFYNNKFKDTNILINIKDMYKNVEEFLDKGEIIPCEYAKTLNYISRLIDDGELELTTYDSRIPISIQQRFKPFKKVDKELILEKTKEYQKKLNTPVSAEILLTALYNIRKIEYYQNPDKYPFTKEDIIKTLINSRWNFPKTQEEILIEVLFGKKMEEKNRIRLKLLDYLDENETEKNIARIKLTKTLSKINKHL